MFTLVCSCNNDKVETHAYPEETKGNETNGSSAIIGRWKLEEIDYSQFLSEQNEEVRTAFEEEMKIGFERLRNKTFFEFAPKGQMSVEEPDDAGLQSFHQGEWRINEKSDTLIFKIPQEEIYEIIRLNSSEMILATDESPKRTLYFSKTK